MDVNTENSILQNLFDLGLEEIIQKIFIYLDSKSLKNAKQACALWKEFIDRRIWKSKSARGHLYNELIYKWKNEKSMLLWEKDLSEYGMYISFVVCDMQVIVCSLRSGNLLTFDVNTCKLLYSLDLACDIQSGGIQMDVSTTQIIIVCVDSGLVKILDKVSGKELFSGYQSNSVPTETLGIKMLENIGIAGDQNGMISFYRKSNEEINNFWEVESVNSGIGKITHIEGDEQRLVIGSRNGVYLWDMNKMKVIPSETPINVKVWMLSFRYPFVFVVGGNDWNGIQTYDIVKGRLLRHNLPSIPFHNIHCNGRFLVLSEMMNHRTPINVAIYDTEELIEPSLRNQDLWSNKHIYTSASYSFSSVVGVSNMTKLIVTNRNTMCVFDFWKDQDYNEGDEAGTLAGEELICSRRIQSAGSRSGEDRQGRRALCQLQ